MIKIEQIHTTPEILQPSSAPIVLGEALISQDMVHRHEAAANRKFRDNVRMVAAGTAVGVLGVGSLGAAANEFFPVPEGPPVVSEEMAKKLGATPYQLANIEKFEVKGGELAPKSSEP